MVQNKTNRSVVLKGKSSLLLYTGLIWFSFAMIGQLIFVAFILSFYGSSIATGNFAAWNDKPLITGYVAGDFFGNLMFAIHMLLAVIITLGGLAQIVPYIRQKFTTFHRWNGRLFIITAYILALGGLWMTWGRGSQLSVISAISVSLNGILIIAFATLAVRFAMQRRFDLHQQWAVSTFLVVNGVWFFRVAIMGWILINQSPRWMNETLSGPADIALSFGSYLVPLAAYYLYRFAKNRSSQSLKIFASIIILLLTLFMIVGIAGATLFMWFPSS